MIANTPEYMLEHCKERSPAETVSIVKEILHKIGIEVEEKMLTKSSIGTYSLRLTIKGSSIGTNGKGLSEVYARASAYAEFLERLQNMKLISVHAYATLLSSGDFRYNFFPDEVFLTAEELVEENGEFVKFLFSERELAQGDRQKKIDVLNKLQKMDYNFFRIKNRFLCVPFDNITKGSVEHAPYFLYNFAYGSNGMCAGNSREEALVQGLSEIFERAALKEIIEKKLSLPDIPISYLASFENIYELYLKAQQMKNYTFIIKDCSIGGKYPVVGLLVIEKNTGKYGFKLGSHVNPRIALERIFTEAMQGADLHDFSKNSNLDFSNSMTSTDFNQVNSFVCSKSDYPYEIMLEKPSYDFVPMGNESVVDNKYLMKLALKKFEESDLCVLAHDVSYTGFSSYHILIPGFSEMRCFSDAEYEAQNTRFHIRSLLNHPSIIDRNNCKYLLGTLIHFRNYLNENTLGGMSGFLSSYAYEGKEHGVDNMYMTAMCHAFLKDYSSASNSIMSIIIFLKNELDTSNPFYDALYQYFTGKINGLEHDELICYLQKFFDFSVCGRIDEIFNDESKIFEKQYPCIDTGAPDFSINEYAEDLFKYKKAVEKYMKYVQ
ncbi:MAG: YcaO-like family protein [Synergistaceae bacterium]|nr:YcaO-like family protein [Synergistaceae bacterium]